MSEKISQNGQHWLYFGSHFCLNLHRWKPYMWCITINYTNLLNDAIRQTGIYITICDIFPCQFPEVLLKIKFERVRNSNISYFKREGIPHIMIFHITTYYNNITAVKERFIQGILTTSSGIPARTLNIIFLERIRDRPLNRDKYSGILTGTRRRFIILWKKDQFIHVTFAFFIFFAWNVQNRFKTKFLPNRRILVLHWVWQFHAKN